MCECVEEMNIFGLTPVRALSAFFFLLTDPLSSSFSLSFSLSLFLCLSQAHPLSFPLSCVSSMAGHADVRRMFGLWVSECRYHTCPLSSRSLALSLYIYICTCALLLSLSLSLSLFLSGVTLYFLLFGNVPFSAPTLSNLYDVICTQEVCALPLSLLLLFKISLYAHEIFLISHTHTHTYTHIHTHTHTHTQFSYPRLVNPLLDDLFHRLLDKEQDTRITMAEGSVSNVSLCVIRVITPLSLSLLPLSPTVCRHPWICQTFAVDFVLSRLHGEERMTWLMVGTHTHTHTHTYTLCLPHFKKVE